MATRDKADIEELLHPECVKGGKAVKSVVAAPETETVATKTLPNDVKDAEAKDAVTKDAETKIGFLFDVIIVRLDISPKSSGVTDKLNVEVIFNNNTLKITSSRINVLDFKPGRSFEFYAKPEILKNELSQNLLKIKVANEENVLGAIFAWCIEFNETNFIINVVTVFYRLW